MPCNKVISQVGDEIKRGNEAKSFRNVVDEGLNMRRSRKLFLKDSLITTMMTGVLSSCRIGPRPPRMGAKGQH